MTMECWRRRSGVLLAGAGTGYVAYDLATDRLHRLNATAALVMELCDGRRGRAEILAALRPLVGDAALPSCAEWLATAERWGLMERAEGAPADAGLTAGELDERAAELRDHGRVLAAFAVQSRAVELDGGHPPRLAALGELAHIVGRRDEARAAYEAYLRLCPDDAEVAHLLRALGDGPPPSRASDRCVEQLYERFASFYDTSMRGDLGYQAPEFLARAVRADGKGRADLEVLDLGCGTGLAGRRLRRLARRLVGIDLSAPMLERARRRRIYDHLEQAEMTEWLGRDRPEAGLYDLIVSCDALIYFGDLGPVVGPAARRLRPGGRLAFTLEATEAEAFRLTDSGRYAHGPGHVAAVAAAAGLTVGRLDRAVLRHEYGEPVAGLVVVLRAAERRANWGG